MKRNRIDLRGIEERLRQALSNTRSRGSASGANVSNRANKAVAVNAGGTGSRRAATSRQRIRIKQDPGGTVEEIESRETRED